MSLVRAKCRSFLCETLPKAFRIMLSSLSATASAADFFSAAKLVELETWKFTANRKGYKGSKISHQRFIFHAIVAPTLFHLQNKCWLAWRQKSASALTRAVWTGLLTCGYFSITAKLILKMSAVSEMAIQVFPFLRHKLLHILPQWPVGDQKR